MKWIVVKPKGVRVYMGQPTTIDLLVRTDEAIETLEQDMIDQSDREEIIKLLQDWKEREESLRAANAAAAK
jgi:hypothetical protein